jgi:hypothetical protein
VQFKNLAVTIKDVMSGERGVRFRETGCAEELIYPEEKFSVPELLDIEGKPHRFFGAYEAAVPPFYVRSLKNGMCYTFGEEVYTSDCRVILEYNTQKTTPPVRWRRFLGKVTRIGGGVVHLGLIGLERNYYHWIADCLVRLLLIRRSAFRPDFYVVSNALGFQKEWLDLLGIRERQIIPIEPHRTVQADELIVPSFVFNRNRELAEFEGGYHHWQTQWHPHWIGELYKEFRPEGGKGKGRIYVSRANALGRKVVNEDSLLPLLGKYGFTVIHPEKLPVRKQIEAFANAEAVVGVHGAGLANCVFCPPRTPVLELYSRHYPSSGPRTLLLALNLRYFYMVGESPDTSIPLGRQNIVIDPGKFEAALKTML